MIRRRSKKAPCRQCGKPTPLPYGVPRDDVLNPVRCASCAAERQRIIDKHIPGFIAAADTFVARMRERAASRSTVEEGEG